ncbi:uracil-xanthine permease family protein [Garciella nitratireducens]|uniref:Nucleobase:cation symporter-2, NCS2 family n=1 Tax=Garciella nitratireducens DSM 15102 TaxID=1121911 RepID=A0A1T4MNZ7_9FIRM|nr:nucleobase:cation symporter-2 family protein [Garciella nitratireducens]SJZ68820.1 nucleobase:cation symporter-2, NCS2 family [Garciella nitratireducens DSM 15102]
MTKEFDVSIQNGIRYKVDDKPPLGEAILLALQNIFAAFGGIIAVPLIICQTLNLSVEDTAIMVSAAIFVSGITTFLQSKGIGPVGARVSGMMGTDFTFVGPSIAVGSSLGLPGLFGATILGSLVEIILSRFIKPLMKFFPPLITGIVVSLIGLTLLPVSIDWMAGGAGSADYGSVENIAVAMIVMLITLLLNQYGKGLFSPAAAFIGIIAGYMISYPLGMIDFTPVIEAKWIAIPSLFKYGVNFDFMAVLSFIPAYLVATIGTFGVMVAIGEASNKPLNSDEISSGVLADGVGSCIAGLFGAPPNTTFSQNVGLITLTGVASRFVMILAAIIMCFLGVFPKLGALISIMPSPVLGGVGIIMFGLVAAQGIKTLSTIKLGNRELLIISVSFALALGVSVKPEVLSQLPTALQMIFSSGISTGTIIALLLNIILKEGEIDKENNTL